MYKEYSSTEGYKREETAFGRAKAHLLRKEAISDYSKAENLATDAAMIQGKPVQKHVSAHPELLKRRYR